MSVIGQIIGMGTGEMSVVYKYAAIAFVVLALVSAAGIKGYKLGENKYRAIIADYKTQVSDLNTKLALASGKIQTEVVTKYVTKIVTIHDIITTDADAAKNLVPDTGILSLGWLNTHNAAALGVLVDPTAAKDATPSGVTVKEGLASTVDNYGVCKENQTKLDSLQEYVTRIKAQVDAYNKQLATKKLK